jgi:hypothetical protein
MVCARVRKGKSPGRQGKGIVDLGGDITCVEYDNGKLGKKLI